MGWCSVPKQLRMPRVHPAAPEQHGAHLPTPYFTWTSGVHDLLRAPSSSLHWCPAPFACMSLPTSLSPEAHPTLQPSWSEHCLLQTPCLFHWLPYPSAQRCTSTLAVAHLCPKGFFLLAQQLQSSATLGPHAESLPFIALQFQLLQWGQSPALARRAPAKIAHPWEHSISPRVLYILSLFFIILW